MSVPCGRCGGCRKDRANAWAFRLLEEEKLHQLSYFATLTYDEDHVKGSDFGLTTLCKKDLQRFFRKLRKHTKCKSIKYYACGEYGGTTARPHYHMIIFDATEAAISKAWYKGFAQFEPVNIRTIRYVCKYIDKPRLSGMSEDDDREREFSLMSKNLGKGYISPAIVKYHNDGLFRFVTLPGGIRAKMPRYYAERIFHPVIRELLAEIAIRESDISYKRACREVGSESLYIAQLFAGQCAFEDLFMSQRYSSRYKL